MDQQEAFQDFIRISTTIAKNLKLYYLAFERLRKLFPNSEPIQNVLDAADDMIYPNERETTNFNQQMPSCTQEKIESDRATMEQQQSSSQEDPIYQDPKFRECIDELQQVQVMLRDKKVWELFMEFEELPKKTRDYIPSFSLGIDGLFTLSQPSQPCENENISAACEAYEVQHGLETNGDQQEDEQRKSAQQKNICEQGEVKGRSSRRSSLYLKDVSNQDSTKLQEKSKGKLIIETEGGEKFHDDGNEDEENDQYQRSRRATKLPPALLSPNWSKAMKRQEIKKFTGEQLELTDLIFTPVANETEAREVVFS